MDINEFSERKCKESKLVEYLMLLIKKYGYNLC